LAALTGVVVWLSGLSLGGVHQVLRRCRVHYRRGQRHVHSPDPAYDTKLAAVATARAEATARPGKVAFLYQDELTYYRRPSVAQTYAPAGGAGPAARQGHGSNTKRRIIGSLDAQTGRLFVWQRSRADVDTLIRYYRELEAAYPTAEVIYLAQDNWPVHFHARILAALANSRVRLLRLPTYAPWTNPIEKAWRWLYQEVLHQHDFADRWDDLQQAVGTWLAKWDKDSPDLLRYVGLARSNS
jgi:transposase